MSAQQNDGTRWLCSQFVTLRPEKGTSVAGVLEELTECEALVGVDDPFEVGTVLNLSGLPDELSVEFVDFSTRETDFAMRVRFVDGYRWSPSSWVLEYGLDISQPKSAAAGDLA